MGFKLVSLALGLLLVSTAPLTHASDHIDGPVTTAHRIADISDLYAFPTPSNPNSLTIIMNAYPIVPTTGHFSEKVSHGIFVRKASLKANGTTQVFETADEAVIKCTFVTPHDTVNHSVTCTTSNGLRAMNKYGVVSANTGDFKVFAGMRSDPFFFNKDFAEQASLKGKILAPKNADVMANINVLSIVIEIEPAKLLKDFKPGLLALVAQTTTQDKVGAPVRILDRVGRPEITNVSLVSHAGDAELRDDYNLQIPFQVKPEALAAYRQRLDKNVIYYDTLDRKTNWQPAVRAHLVSLFSDDFLVVDTSKPCTGAKFLEIEKSLLAGKVHQTCGGRRLTDDIMDIMFSMYIGGPAGAIIRDGVDAPHDRPSQTFPYLVSPDFSPFAKAKMFLAKKALGIKDIKN